VLFSVLADEETYAPYAIFHPYPRDTNFAHDANRLLDFVGVAENAKTGTNPCPTHEAGS